MPIDYENLGIRVRSQRKRRKMTQVKLASVTGMSTQHVSNIEHAKTKVSLEKVVDIANALECSADELLCDSIEKASMIFMNEAEILIENLTDAQKRALPEFLRSYSYFCNLVEKDSQQKDV